MEWILDKLGDFIFLLVILAGILIPLFRRKNQPGTSRSRRPSVKRAGPPPFPETPTVQARSAPRPSRGTAGPPPSPPAAELEARVKHYLEGLGKRLSAGTAEQTSVPGSLPPAPPPTSRAVPRPTPATEPRSGRSTPGSRRSPGARPPGVAGRSTASGRLERANDSRLESLARLEGATFARDTLRQQDQGHTADTGRSRRAEWRDSLLVRELRAGPDRQKVLRKGVLWREILGRPVAMRGERELAGREPWEL